MQTMDKTLGRQMGKQVFDDFSLFQFSSLAQEPDQLFGQYPCCRHCHPYLIS
jgi:hypothetical protein